MPSCFDKIVTWEGAPWKKISQSLDSAYSSVAQYKYGLNWAAISPAG